ncbi:MAG TPA: VWA domain-containing protein [Burkholderiales bacterium]|nr:VWA domain-containing protein [Burkholderiales bacterium]
MAGLEPAGDAVSFPVTLQSSWALLLLLLVPLLWWIAGRTGAHVSRRHLLAATALRSLALVMLALALARPQWNSGAGDVSVVYALDVSRSIPAGYLESALKWIGAADREAAPAQSRYLAFADQPRLVEGADGLAKVPVAQEAAPGVLDQSQTNLERALDEALLGLDRDGVKRLVLMTDGNQTAGDVWRVLPRLKAAGVRVYPVPAKPRDDGDAWVDGIEVPGGLRAQEPVKVAVRVYAPRAMPAKVRLRHGPAIAGSRVVRLKPGLNRIVFEAQLGQPGLATLSAELQAQGDGSVENNVVRQSAWVGSRARVLYVEGQPSSAGYLRDALAAQGIQVTVAPAAELPGQAAGLSAYDAILLSDVPAKALSAPQMQAIQAYVRDQGGGLVFTSGENVFGEKGYSDSALESALPVRFRAQEKRKDLALVVVLDRSYSMKGRKMELAKEATRAALDLLEEQHEFAVVTFDSQTYVSVPLEKVRSKRKAEDQISRIQASGQTNIYPALGITYRLLQKSRSRNKHVILLSDGDTHPADFEGLLKRMTTDKIVVSTVAVGDGADRELMTNIARWGNGRSYSTVGAESLPQIFVEETQRAVRANLGEEPFRPVVKHRMAAFEGVDIEQAPPLKGFVASQARESAEVLLATPSESPVLARWQYGLGKVVVFTSDVKNRWASQWLEWPGYGRLWAQVTRGVMRRESGEQLDFRVDREGTEAVVTLSALTPDGRFRGDLSPRVRMVAADGTASILDLPRTGAGTYQLRVPIRAGARPARFELMASPGIGRAAISQAGPREIFYARSDEYRAFPPNMDLLRTLAEQTGGKVAPEIADVFDRQGDESRRSRPLWPWLALLGLLLYLGDIFVRRSPWAWRRFGS